MSSTPGQTCPDCDCGDSPLSVLANVLGILTFALGLAASFAAFAAITRGATREMEETWKVCSMAGQQIAQADRFLTTLHYRSDADLKAMEELVRDSLDALKAARKEMESDLREFKMDDTERESPRLPSSSRLKWWYYERGVRAGVMKLRESQQHFAAVQLMLLQR